MFDTNFRQITRHPSLHFRFLLIQNLIVWSSFQLRAENQNPSDHRNQSEQGSNHQNEWELKIKSGTLCKARKKAGNQVEIGFSFAFD